MKTPLYDRHVAGNARIVDFHGWDMPLYYSSILTEHMAVRKNYGFFDVSHMGDVAVEGKDAARFLDHILPSRISSLLPGRAMYSAFLNEDGNIIDDTIVYRLAEERFFFVPNASTTGEIMSWTDQNSEGFDVRLRNVSNEIASIALQGPEAHRAAAEVGITEPEPFTFHTVESQYENAITGRKETIVSGTGYTGEKGMELIIPAREAVSYWEKLESLTGKLGGIPCGLGSRDTLRMEKGMLLSGTDFDHDRTPFEASISFIVNADHDFIGREKLMAGKEKKREIFRGFRLEGKALPRGGSRIIRDGKHVGTVTSGGISPVLGVPIALGYIDRESSKENTPVEIEIRSSEHRATVSRPKLVK